jgi:RNA polymerase sigma-70 factor (ECF subfamily)
VKHFLADQRDRARAAKRGAGRQPLPLEDPTDQHSTAAVQIPDPLTPPPDAFFDRQWALNLIDQALKGVAVEYAAPGKSVQFEILKPWLVGEVRSFSQADAAARLGLSEGAVKVAIHRLRKRFREAVKAQITVTLEEGQSVQVELQYLLEALAHC